MSHIGLCIAWTLSRDAVGLISRHLRPKVSQLFVVKWTEAGVQRNSFRRLIAMLESLLVQSLQTLIALLKHLSSIVSVLNQLQHADVNCHKLICTFSVMHCSESNS